MEIMEFKRLDPPTLDQIEKTWMAILKKETHDVIKTYYSQAFGFIKTMGCWETFKDCLNKPIYSYIVDKHGEVWAIVQIVQSKNGSSVWVKMMEIILSPKLELSSSEETDLNARVNVFSSTLVGIFNLSAGIAKADTIKIYGRTDSFLSFLKVFHSTFHDVLGRLPLRIPGLEIAIEGQWLVFRRSSSRGTRGGN